MTYSRRSNLCFGKRLCSYFVEFKEISLLNFKYIIALNILYYKKSFAIDFLVSQYFNCFLLTFFRCPNFTFKLFSLSYFKFNLRKCLCFFGCNLLGFELSLEWGLSLSYPTNSFGTFFNYLGSCFSAFHTKYNTRRMNIRHRVEWVFTF